MMNNRDGFCKDESVGSEGSESPSTTTTRVSHDASKMVRRALSLHSPLPLCKLTRRGAHSTSSLLQVLQIAGVSPKSFRGHDCFKAELSPQKFGASLSFSTIGTISLLRFLFVCCVPLRQCRSHCYCLLDWNAHAREHDACVVAGLICSTQTV